MNYEIIRMDPKATIPPAPYPDCLAIVAQDVFVAWITSEFLTDTDDGVKEQVIQALISKRLGIR